MSGLFFLPMLMVCLACGGSRPQDLGEAAGLLRACPAPPNCVSSDASDEEHHIAPIEIIGVPTAAFEKARQILADWPRTEIVRDDPGYLYVECTSALLRFKDDLELVLRSDRNEIAVRSASRLGYSDMGANRKRVEKLRAELAAAGMAKPAAAPHE